MRWHIRALVLVGSTVAAMGRPAMHAQEPTQFRATASGVAVDVSVRDGRRAVIGLTAADFVLLDNGVPQQIAAASLERIPLDVTLVVDTSGSLRCEALAQFRRDILTVTGLLGTYDRFRVVTFATRAGEAFGWHSGSEMPDVVRLPAGGATALYQTLAAVLLRRPEPGRRQLILVLSDGVDNVSLLDAPDVLEIARRADALMHIVLRRPIDPLPTTAAMPADMGQAAPTRGVGSVGINRLPPARGSWGWVPYEGLGQDSVLRDAAEATGGRFRIAALSTSLADAFRVAIDEFRTSYVLWFTPEGVEPTGWHTLEVRLRDGRHEVRARTGYQAGGR